MQLTDPILPKPMLLENRSSTLGVWFLLSLACDRARERKTLWRMDRLGSVTAGRVRRPQDVGLEVRSSFQAIVPFLLQHNVHFAQYRSWG